MQGKDSLFLSIREVLDAVSIAFAQYPSQVNLIKGLWPLVFGRDAYVIKDATCRHFWAKTSKRAKLVAAGEHELKQWIVDHLKQSPPPLDQLAQICRHVFGTPAHAGSETSTGNEPAGIWIKTDMGGFSCTRCGHCCRTLNYHDGCSLDDYRRWQELGRKDILAWVGTVRKNGAVIACRIWMEPGTNHYADMCPWLRQVDQSARFSCAIHDVRPMICRQYPGTRKHARLTGCRGV